MWAKKYLAKLPLDTPPVFVRNSRQLSSFLQQLKIDPIRLCVEIVENEETNPKKDPNGASSEDDEYGRCGRFTYDEEEREENLKNLPHKKRGLSSIPEFVKLEMRSVDLAVGQRYDTKEDSEMRLQIFSVAHQFDYNVRNSTPTLLTVKCWVGGCTWRLCASTVGQSPNFYVKTYVGKHSCSITERSTRARKATFKLLGHLYIDFIGGVGPSVLPSHLADAITKRFRIKIYLFSDGRFIMWNTGKPIGH
ncbi:unnamed protein product [Arabis nemorensis]|uniref:Transposase MuDR plant domain-containing protein n=1 Tax=Arabis nemorensis TaxID=586526 RepID=A0A565C2A7_9BRAS|nr:unnamed protein product [Arabis nemorensis]